MRSLSGMMQFSVISTELPGILSQCAVVCRGKAECDMVTGVFIMKGENNGSY